MRPFFAALQQPPRLSVIPPIVHCCIAALLRCCVVALLRRCWHRHRSIKRLSDTHPPCPPAHTSLARTGRLFILCFRVLSVFFDFICLFVYLGLLLSDPVRSASIRVFPLIGCSAFLCCILASSPCLPPPVSLALCSSCSFRNTVSHFTLSCLPGYSSTFIQSSRHLTTAALARLGPVYTII